jgi:hypothetical protein
MRAFGSKGHFLACTLPYSGASASSTPADASRKGHESFNGKLTDLPTQMEQIGNGKLPKDLIDYLKKIEKLSKYIRSELE